MMSRALTLTLTIAAALAVAAPAGAQGHMFHGIGPINSAMGGAGTALPEDSLDALTFNPALISSAQGNQISFTSEFFRDGIQITTTVGTLVGVTHPTLKLNVVPAFGWMVRDPQKKLSLGFGLIGLAGFGTDYPQDDSSILFAQPPRGFGRIFTDYRVTKIPVAFGYQATPKLAIGASVNVYMADFAVAPLPYQVFDTDPAGNRFYPDAGKLSTAWAVAGQLGFTYQVNPMLSIGGSYTMPQKFTHFQWNSTIADPGSPLYGTARTLTYQLDGPMIVSFGTGWKLSKETQLAVDGMFVKYRGVAGFGSPGGVVNGIVQPFGWRNVWTFKAGVQHQVNDTVVVRAGYNYSQMPIRPEVVLTATGAPATFQHHICAGLGFKMFPFLEAEASAYYVPRQHAVGPFPDLSGNVLGTLDESNRLMSALIGLNFHF
jgi:long-chain fatty acid transport protein